MSGGSEAYAMLYDDWTSADSRRGGIRQRAANRLREPSQPSKPTVWAGQQTERPGTCVRRPGTDVKRPGACLTHC
jgi:hypothetical protein